MQFDATYNFYLDDYNNVIAFEEVEGISNYALILDSAFSTNMLNTDAQVKVLLPTGETATYTLNWSATAGNFDDYDLDSDGTADDNGAEYLKYFLGTDDGRAGSAGAYPAAGAAAGNLIAYTLNDNNEITFSLPELSVGGYVNGNSNNYNTANTTGFWHNNLSTQPNGFFENVTDVLQADLLNDDVEVDTSEGDYGIDADTIVYYFDGSDGAVAVGYEAMARSIDHDLNPAGEIDANGVKMSVVSFYKDDVANVMVIYTSQADFGNDEYVLVMPEFNVYSGSYRYTVMTGILERHIVQLGLTRAAMPAGASVWSRVWLLSSCTRSASLAIRLVPVAAGASRSICSSRHGADDTVITKSCRS